MKENLGCLLNGHQPTDFGVFSLGNDRFGSSCKWCKQTIVLQVEQLPDSYKKGEWKLTSDV